MIIGWIGLLILVLAYVSLNTKYIAWFIPLDMIATFFLIIHAYLINDIPFFIVNVFIFFMLQMKKLKGGIK